MSKQEYRIKFADEDHWGTWSPLDEGQIFVSDLIYEFRDVPGWVGPTYWRSPSDQIWTAKQEKVEVVYRGYNYTQVDVIPHAES